MASAKADLRALAPDAKPDSHWNFAVRMFKPVVRVMLRFGFSCDDMAQIIRKLAVDLALEKDEFKTREKAFTAPASVITGLSRKEVKKLRELEDIRELVDPQQGNRATRVLDGWLNDPRYRDSDGTPLSRIPVKAASGVSFRQLVKEYGGDVPPGTVLNALVDHGAVTESDGEVRLIRGYYVPVNGSDELTDNIAAITGDALSTAEFNLRLETRNTRFLREWFQRYVPVERLDEAHQLIREESLSFGERVDHRLAAIAHPKPLHNVEYRRVAMGIFYAEGDSGDNHPADK